MLWGLLGFVAGAFVTGMIAHRWPTFFASAVTAVNAADAAVKAEVSSVTNTASSNTASK